MSLQALHESLTVEAEVIGHLRQACLFLSCGVLHVGLSFERAQPSIAGANAYRVSAALQEDDAKPTRFHKIMRCLYPVVLRLAASAEPIAQQLFHPLIMSLIHWFTRSRRCVSTL